MFHFSSDAVEEMYVWNEESSQTWFSSYGFWLSQAYLFHFNRKRKRCTQRTTGQANRKATEGTQRVPAWTVLPTQLSSCLHVICLPVELSVKDSWKPKAIWIYTISHLGIPTTGVGYAVACCAGLTKHYRHWRQPQDVRKDKPVVSSQLLP